MKLIIAVFVFLSLHHTALSARVKGPAGTNEKPAIIDCNKPYATSWLQSGQLGNQLFEVAATLAYAWDNNFEPLFPELNLKTNLNIPINRERIFFRLNSSPLPQPICYTFTQLKIYEKIDIPIKPNQCLTGYFQTWEYFNHHREKILQVFAPRPEELHRIESKHAALLKHPCTVGIHVRTFNKQWSESIPFVGLSYYEKAIGLFPADALFVVFSDRIGWCKHHFAIFDRPIIFIEDQDHIEDFFLMSMLKHNIICNSTFSWWTAYLNQNPNKVVVAPSHFVNPESYKSFSKFNPNMPDWLVIDIDCDYARTHYPEDIADYDDFSRSIDTQ